MNEKTKSLFGYIFPAMGGLFVTYLYNVVDGIFVGQGVGSAALGAVNIGVPFITFVVAIAAMFPDVYKRQRQCRLQSLRALRRKMSVRSRGWRSKRIQNLYRRPMGEKDCNGSFA